MSASSVRDYRQDAALRPQPCRDGADAWSTPASLIDALITHLLPTLPPGVIWECACGDERLANAMRSAGRQVVATDLHRVGNRIDFLRADPPPPGSFGVVCTNPPFNRLDSFIAHGLQLMDSGRTRSLVLLVRNDALMTDGRVEVLNRAAFALGCNWRARWIPNSTGQPRWAFSWIVWRADHPGPPIALRVRQRVPA